jgi:hypothetical protein
VRDCDAKHGFIAGGLVDYKVTLTAGTSWFSPAFAPHFYTNADGLAVVTLDDHTDVTLVAFRVRPAR